MITSLNEFDLLTKLMVMQDRHLAMMIWQHIFYDCNIAQPTILARYIEFMYKSDTKDDVSTFEELSRIYLQEEGIQFYISLYGYPQRMNNQPKSPDYKLIMKDELVTAEAQEPKI
jgi:hypothetical protein